MAMFDNDYEYDYDSSEIEDLFDDEEYISEDPTWATSWEYNYHNLTDELSDY